MFKLHSLKKKKQKTLHVFSLSQIIYAMIFTIACYSVQFFLNVIDCSFAWLSFLGCFSQFGLNIVVLENVHT